MSSNLHPSMIERCRWKRTPNRAITAPEPQLQFDHTHEDMRLAQFEQSRMTRNGVVAPFPSSSRTNIDHNGDS